MQRAWSSDHERRNLICLANVVYKIASKAIAEKRKPMFDNIISPTQSAFIPVWLIMDYVLLVFKLNHYLKTKSRGSKGYMDLKVDISKVEWAFLKQVMSKLGFLCSPSCLILSSLIATVLDLCTPNKDFAKETPSPLPVFAVYRGFQHTPLEIQIRRSVFVAVGWPSN